MRQYLPKVIYTAIQSHLRNAAILAEGGWDAGNDEEDTLTGDLGATLRRTWSVPVSIDGHEWRWQVTYKKFRGRGPGAFEKYRGADGIFQIEIENIETSEFIRKGMLFQAKNQYNMRRAELTRQVSDMERLVPGGSAVIEYGPEIYRAFEGRRFLDIGDERPTIQPIRLGDFLADSFLGCTIGTLGMYYDAKRRIIIVPQGDRFRSYRIDIDNRIGIEVEVTH